MLGIIGQSWHRYPIGLLFGLWFDTASEVGIMMARGPASGCYTLTGAAA